MMEKNERKKREAGRKRRRDEIFLLIRIRVRANPIRFHNFNTNPARKFRAVKFRGAALQRWNIETSFYIIYTVLSSRVNFITRLASARPGYVIVRSFVRKNCPFEFPAFFTKPHRGFNKRPINGAELARKQRNNVRQWLFDPVIAQDWRDWSQTSIDAAPAPGMIR